MSPHSLHLPRSPEKLNALRTFFFVVAAAAITFAIALAAGARAGVLGGGIQIGPVSVADGTAVVQGAVGGEPDAKARLDVNGKPVGVDESGHFTAVVDLGGSSVVLTLRTGNRGVTTLRIPVTLLQQGGKGILGDLEAAGISLLVPPNGFQNVDGKAPLVSLRVLDRSRLASLTVDGKEVLNLVGPDGLLSTPASDGPPDQVTVVATDSRHVSQATSYPVTNVSSVIKTRYGRSVSAAGARGVVIAKIRSDRRGLLTHRRLGFVVKVEDRRGYLVRGAAVRLRGMPAKYLANGTSRAGFTNRFGVTRFAYVLQKRAFTDRFPRKLTVSVRASTPSASARKLARTRLPRVPAT